MALVVLLRKPPEHGSIVRIRFRAAVPVEEKEARILGYIMSGNDVYHE